jgi:hypothetical protein
MAETGTEDTGQIVRHSGGEIAVGEGKVSHGESEYP